MTKEKVSARRPGVPNVFLRNWMNHSSSKSIRNSSNFLLIFRKLKRHCCIKKRRSSNSFLRSSLGSSGISPPYSNGASPAMYPISTRRFAPSSSPMKLINEFSDLISSLTGTFFSLATCAFFFAITHWYTGTNDSHRNLCPVPNVSISLHPNPRCKIALGNKSGPINIMPMKQTWCWISQQNLVNNGVSKPVKPIVSRRKDTGVTNLRISTIAKGNQKRPA